MQQKPQNAIKEFKTLPDFNSTLGVILTRNSWEKNSETVPYEFKGSKDANNYLFSHK